MSMQQPRAENEPMMPSVGVTRRKLLGIMALGGSAALLAACQPATPAAPTAKPAAPAKPTTPPAAVPPTTAPAAKAAASPAASPAAKAAGSPVASPAAKAAASPAASPAAKAGDWEAQWNQWLAAAREEGKVVVSGPPTTETRQALPSAFRARFGIEMEYLAQSSTSQLLTRMEAERASGLFTVDGMIAGAQSMYTKALPDGLIDPIKPILIHPEANDGSKWTYLEPVSPGADTGVLRQGKVWFMDPDEQYLPRLANNVTGQIVVNADEVNPAEIQSWRDVLDPKWRGKLSVYDPTRSGSGWNMANYLWEFFGEDYIRSLYRDQEPAVSRDFRQLSDWLARGVQPISLGLRSAEVTQLQSEGFNVAVIQPAGAPVLVAGGFGGLAGLVNQAPHLNAARIFVNWILMPEGQEVLNRSEKGNSIRTDVNSSAWLEDYLIPKLGQQMFDTYGWNFTTTGFSDAKLAELRRITGMQG